MYKVKYLNTITKGGAKVLSEYMLNDVFYRLKKIWNLQPIYIFFEAIRNVRPMIFLRPCILGGVTYYLALVVYTEKKWILYTAQWLVCSLRIKGVVTVQGLVNLISEAFMDKGLAVDQKIECYKKAMDGMPFFLFLARRLLN